MAEFKRIKISEIVIPDRLRAVEEEQALVIAQSMVEHGQINPITVRATPAAKGGKYTLVAGAHRLRACVINDDDEIDAMVVEGDQVEAQLIEITENLFRNELSVIDRAIFVQTYREVWEQRHGEIQRGGARKSKDQVDPLTGNRINLIQLLADEAASTTFAAHVADRMGISVPSYKRLNAIAQNLHPKVREQLRGTPYADNQSELLKIAKLGPTEQSKFAIALADKKDVKTAWAALDPGKPKGPLSETDRQRAIQAELEAVWKRADAHTHRFFLLDIGVPKELADQVVAALAARAAE
ncbi:ParB N-terminal domain-containing protein [Shinella kummerowiae]|uniref:ParB N-terminal domain-containing protein n=1 Tax=Shinella kummerowiae TaxID=417745 RepID=UPI0021B4EED7|nr:ParB N-terminal domain-containing protein [Shinella kummerowiae]MCT7667652.1 ParB N-terminal domain-containing protein [Shinella kummerowiae]